MKARRLEIIRSRCPQNHPCPAARSCPSGALKQRGFQAPEVSDDACIRCGVCAARCPKGALVLK